MGDVKRIAYCSFGADSTANVLLGMDYWHKAWTCPFFKWDDQKIVGCEGGKLRFQDKEHAVEYMDAYCAGTGCDWKKCSLAASLLKYYDRQGDNDHEQCER